jgi:hypothetical protein
VSGPDSTNRQSWFIAFALVLLVSAVYSSVLSCGFVNLDDPNHVLENPVVVQRDVAGAFTQAPAALWVPLTWLSYIAEVAVAGFEAWHFHLINLFLHAANVVLVWRWIEGATGRRWPAVVVAVFFAVHPLNVESVAWVTERKNVLSTFFWLLALCAHTRFARSGSWRDYAAALLACAAGLMSKPMVVTLPFTLLLLDAWPLGRFTSASWRRVLVEKIPFFLLSLGAAAVTVYAHHEAGGLQTAEALPLTTRVLNAGASYALYLREMVWPLPLGVQVRPPQSIGATAGIIGWVVVAVLSAIVWRLRKWEPALLWGWLWYLGTLVPVIGLVQAGSEASADRFTYVPQLGIFVGATWVLWRWADRPVVRVAAALAGAACAAMTVWQIGFWENGLVLFEHSSAINPDSHRARANAGYMNSRAGNYLRAIQHYKRALELRPTDSETWNNLGGSFVRLGDDKRAVFAFQQAVKLKPDFLLARKNLADTEQRLKAK